jgi:predicted ArsR family transcriptional regulator
MKLDLPMRFRGPKCQAVITSCTGKWITHAQVVEESRVSAQSVKWYLGDLVASGIVQRKPNDGDSRGRFLYRLAGS